MRSPRLAIDRARGAAHSCHRIGLALNIGRTCACIKAAPTVLRGQGAGPSSKRSSLGLAGGVFKYEPSEDNGSPILAVRLDRPVSRWTRLEVGTSYTRPEIQADDEGFFGRYEGGPAGRSFGRSTFQFPLGIRLWATDHIGLRGEYRFDQDRHEVFTNSDSEMTAGVFWTF